MTDPHDPTLPFDDDPAYTHVDPATGIAPCCKDPSNRRVSTIDPALVAAARGGTPGLQVCCVCGRRHYTFLPDVIAFGVRPARDA